MIAQRASILRNCVIVAIAFQGSLAAFAQEALIHINAATVRHRMSPLLTGACIEDVNLVNNAGVSVVKPLHEHTPAEWDWVMNTNVKAVYWAASRVIPIMLRQRQGVILNTGSISGLVGIAGQGAYAASKGAIHQMTRQMAVEYAASGIRVNAIALGTVDTPILHRAARESPNPDTFIDNLRSQHPIGRIATADEAARFITFLASDSATFFTGAILSLDGGYTAR